MTFMVPIRESPALYIIPALRFPTPVLHNVAPPSALSDIAPRDTWVTKLELFLVKTSVPHGWILPIPSAEEWQQIASLWSESVARALQKVISRQPIPIVTPDPGLELSDAVPEGTPYGSLYLTAYVVETLECGHELHFVFIPEAEPLTAKRRVCPDCTTGQAIPKKPSHSVKAAERKRA